MSLVIGILQPANSRSRCPHPLGQFPLAQSRLRSQLENLARNLGIQRNIFKLRYLRYLMSSLELVEKLKRLRFEFTQANTLAWLYSLDFSVSVHARLNVQSAPRSWLP
jgi:hypothetical protein